MSGFGFPRGPRRLGRRFGGWRRAGLALAAGFVVSSGCNDSGGTGTTPDYTITLNPTALTILPGAADVTTVTLSRTDFDGEVTFSVSGAPAGITSSFAPQVTTGDNSTLTISASAITAPGLYNISVRGAATAGNRSRGLAITVSPPLPDFQLSAAPSSITVAQGGTGTTGIAIARTDFTGPVTLAVTEAPAGVTGSFDPAAPTGTNSVLTVTVGAAVPPGQYDVTVEGTGAPGARTTSFSLTVTP